MQAVDIIARTRDGQELTDGEIRWFVGGCADGTIPDYQAAAWLMAVYLHGLTDHETVDLTRAMAESGQTLDLGRLAPRAVDKHSSGGVGDKISLVVGPIAAAVGVVVAKMSGRGLGSTGGTLDKLESIPGLRVSLSTSEIVRQAAEVGLVIASQTADLAPADGRLYALRDVTATVSSLPLIVSSILSKKLAGGAPSIVLDVKAGSGAFMTDVPSAIALARALATVGNACGRRVVAYVTRMDQPLGQAVGNAVEVAEAIDVLAGGGPADVRALAVDLAAEMIQLAGLAPTDPEARLRAEEVMANGSALAKLRDMIEAQGGDPRVVDEPDRLPRAPVVDVVRSPETGYISQLDAGIVGRTVASLGAGRAHKGDPIDHRVGVIFHRKLGDHVEVGDPLFTLHLAQMETAQSARELLLGAYGWSSEEVLLPVGIVDRIDGAAPKTEASTTG